MYAPPEQHPAFDALCSRLDEFEMLPTVTPHPVPESEQDRDPSAGDEDRTAPLDELILAGLVSL
jgi:hypothetical protein